MHFFIQGIEWNNRRTTSTEAEKDWALVSYSEQKSVYFSKTLVISFLQKCGQHAENLTSVLSGRWSFCYSSPTL